jgi:surface antigen
VNPYTGRYGAAVGVLAAALTLAGCSGFDLREPSSWTSAGQMRRDAGAGFGTANAAAGKAAPVRPAGGLLGGAIGQGLDGRAQGLAVEAQNRALDAPAGARPVPWTTDDGQASGDVVPGTPFAAGGRNCRDYTQRIHVDGQTRTARGVACRNTDGSWSPA